MTRDLHLIEAQNHKKVKCVVWDLDNTVWDGILLEDNNVQLRKEAADIIRTLDSRGILQSIASKNEYGEAMEKLRELGIAEYFIYPQISWNPKSSAISTIAKSINIAVDSLAFVDDQPFELDEVRSVLPEVLCIDAGELDGLLELPQMNPRFITEDSKRRRLMYLSDIRRNSDEEKFEGPKEEFLESLGMVLRISPVAEADLQRAEELTIRTHQLNTTGYSYSYEELSCYSKSDKHKLLILDLEDKYGTYGKIGLVLIECNENAWVIKLLLLSCRVMSRGIGTVLIQYIMKLAAEHRVKLQAEFVPNDRNRMMYITYKFTGFKEAGERDGIIILENDLTFIQPMPNYLTLYISE